MDPLDLSVAAILAGLSFLLLLQMMIAYRRAKNSKLLLLAAGFALFFAEGLLVLAALAGTASLSGFAISRELLIVNLLIVALLYAGTVKS